MPNSTKPVDLYSNFNLLIGQQAGNALSSTGLTNAITVGQAAQLYGYETTLNSLSIQLGRTLIAVRPYTGGFGLIEADRDEYGQITRKISYFYDGFEESKEWNTATSGAGQILKDGATIDHYTIRKRYPMEINFGGLKILTKSWTRFLSQLKVAFRSREDFERFYRGEAVEIANEIQMMKEAENRMLVLNAIAATYNTGKAGQKVNLTKAYNDKFGTSYTTAQLLTTHLKELTEFFVSTFKFTSDMLTKNSDLYHLTPVKTNDAGETLKLYRHTPKSEQRFMMASSVWYDAQSMVMPEIFNDEYLKLGQAEMIPYWQSPSDPLAINVTPNQFNETTGLSEDGAAVSKPKIIALLYDRPALVTNYRQEEVLTTPVNAKGVYYNTVHHWAKDYQYDATENMVLFYMEDEA